MKCPDYDLCQVCKGKGFHLEHELEAITEPRTRPDGPDFANFPWTYMANAFGSGGSGDEHEGPGGCHRGGHRFRKHGHGHGHHGHGHGHRHGFPGGFPGFRGGLAGFMRPPHGGGPFSAAHAESYSAGEGASSNAGGFAAAGGPFFGAGAGNRCGRPFQGPKTVDEIAKQLAEMGITADGGVLRELIEQFHGDIVKIIEAMN